MKQSVALVLALAQIHNCCINEQQFMEALTARDTRRIERVDTVPIEGDNVTDVLLPTQLIGGGDHFQGVDRNVRRQQL